MVDPINPTLSYITRYYSVECDDIKTQFHRWQILLRPSSIIYLGTMVWNMIVPIHSCTAGRSYQGYPQLHT